MESLCKDWNSTTDSDVYQSIFGYNYLELYDCYGFGVVLILCILLIPLCFYLLGSTADEYFSPTLGRICNKLGLSPGLAGVTILAFGNGAPDVFSSIASFTAGGENSSPDLGISALLGAACFLITIVLGNVCRVSPGLKVARAALLRDIAFFYITMSLIGLWFWTQVKIGLLEAFLFLSVYAVYVTTVFFYDHIQRDDDDSVSEMVSSHDAGVISAFWHINDDDSSTEHRGVSTGTDEDDVYEFATTTPASSYVSLDDARNNLEINALAQGQPRPPRIAENYIRSPDSPRALLERMSESHVMMTNPNPSSSVLSNFYTSQLRLHRRAALNWLREWQRMEPYQVVTSILETPFTILRGFTIPSMDSSDWSKSVTVLQPFCIVPFYMFVLGLDFSATMLSLGFVFAFILCVFLQLILRASQPPKGFTLPMLLLTFAFCSCVGWIFCVANELVALLSILGYMLKVNTSILGLTVLAMGNSCGDFFANSAIARNGMGNVAIAGCFGAPLLNILLGLGISFFLIAFREDYRFEVSNSCVASISMIMLILAIIGVSFANNHYVAPVYLPKLLVGAYALYVALSLLVVAY